MAHPELMQQCMIFLRVEASLWFDYTKKAAYNINHRSQRLQINANFCVMKGDEKIIGWSCDYFWSSRCDYWWLYFTSHEFGP